MLISLTCCPWYIVLSAIPCSFPNIVSHSPSVFIVIHLVMIAHVFILSLPCAVWSLAILQAVTVILVTTGHHCACNKYCYYNSAVLP
jgi:hypothetical protein